MTLSNEDRAAIQRVAMLLRDVARKPCGSWATLSVCVDGRALVASETGSYSSGRTVRADLDGSGSGYGSGSGSGSGYG